MNDNAQQAGMQEVNVDHVNAMLQVLTDQRNAALNNSVQLQAEVIMVRKQNEALAMQVQNLSNALDAATAKSAEADDGKTPAKK
jgi:hypothetical protein